MVESSVVKWSPEALQAHKMWILESLTFDNTGHFTKMLNIVHLNNKMLSLVIYAKYEGSDIAKKLPNPYKK